MVLRGVRVREQDSRGEFEQTVLYKGVGLGLAGYFT